MHTCYVRVLVAARAKLALQVTQGRGKAGAAAAAAQGLWEMVPCPRGPLGSWTDQQLAPSSAPSQTPSSTGKWCPPLPVAVLVLPCVTKARLLLHAWEQGVLLLAQLRAELRGARPSLQHQVPTYRGIAPVGDWATLRARTGLRALHDPPRSHGRAHSCGGWRRGDDCRQRRGATQLAHTLAATGR